MIFTQFYFISPLFWADFLSGFVELTIPDMESGSHSKSDEPLNVVKASRQYVFTESGEEYLDCLNGSAHIGHTHPQVRQRRCKYGSHIQYLICLKAQYRGKYVIILQVVSTATSQISKLTTTQGFVSDLLTQFVKQLVLLLPEELNVVYMCNTGVEANDLALLLAKEYTGNKDLVTFEGAYHGYLLSLLDVSPKLSNTSKDHVHVVTVPDMYRGPYARKRYNSIPEKHSKSQSVSLSCRF